MSKTMLLIRDIGADEVVAYFEAPLSFVVPRTGEYILWNQGTYKVKIVLHNMNDQTVIVVLDVDASDSVTVDTEIIQTSPDGTTSKEVYSINLKKVYHLEEG